MGKVKTIPLQEKLNLSLDEAAVYSGIGMHKIREMMNEPDCDFVLNVGPRKRLIKRAKFERYLSVHEYI